MRRGGGSLTRRGGGGVLFEKLRGVSYLCEGFTPMAESGLCERGEYAAGNPALSSAARQKAANTKMLLLFFAGAVFICNVFLLFSNVEGAPKSSLFKCLVYYFVLFILAC